MSSKLKILIGINIVLLGTIASTFFFSGDAAQARENDVASALAMQDTAGIRSIHIGDQTFSKQEGIWYINNRYKVDPYALGSIAKVLMRLESKRPASEKQAPYLQELFKSSTQVRVKYDQAPEYNLQLAGDSLNTYCSDGSTYHIVHVPGYRVNLIDFFKGDEQTWRDRRILFTTWKTMKRISLDYIGDPENSFTIAFKDNFYQIDGVDKLDSAKLYRYVKGFERFSVGKYFQAGEIPTQVFEQTPICKIVVSDFYEDRNDSLALYPFQKRLIGQLASSGEAVGIEPKVLQQFLVNKAFFVAKEGEKGQAPPQLP